MRWRGADYSWGITGVNYDAEYRPRSCARSLGSRFARPRELSRRGGVKAVAAVKKGQSHGGVLAKPCIALRCISLLE